MKQKRWDEWIAKGDLPIGATCWVADLYEEDLVRDFMWGGYSIFDERLLERGLIFRTKTQALECAKRMLAAAKGEHAETKCDRRFSG